MSSLTSTTRRCWATWSFAQVPAAHPRDDGHITASLIAHEEAIAEMRRHSNRGRRDGPAFLQAHGRPDLARRLRNVARSRGAMAHLDTSLAQSIREAFGAWSPRDLCDDRTLRRHPSSVATSAEPVRSGESEAVKRPTGAAPCGGPDLLERRVEALERHLNQVSETQLNQGIHFHAELDWRIKDVHSRLEDITKHAS